MTSWFGFDKTAPTEGEPGGEKERINEEGGSWFNWVSLGWGQDNAVIEEETQMSNSGGDHPAIGVTAYDEGLPSERKEEKNRGNRKKLRKKVETNGTDGKKGKRKSSRIRSDDTQLSGNIISDGEPWKKKKKAKSKDQETQLRKKNKKNAERNIGQYKFENDEQKVEAERATNELRTDRSKENTSNQSGSVVRKLLLHDLPMLKQEEEKNSKLSFDQLEQSGSNLSLVQKAFHESPVKKNGRTDVLVESDTEIVENKQKLESQESETWISLFQAGDSAYKSLNEFSSPMRLPKSLWLPPPPKGLPVLPRELFPPVNSCYLFFFLSSLISAPPQGLKLVQPPPGFELSIGTANPQFPQPKRFPHDGINTKSTSVGTSKWE